MPGIDECLLEAMTLPGARVPRWSTGAVDWPSAPSGNHPWGTTRPPPRKPPNWPAPPPSTSPSPRRHRKPEPPDPAGPPLEDLIVTTRTGYHVLRFVETSFDSSVFLHLWLDRADGNLALARHRLRALAEGLVLR
ncbi:hypothetical protein GCM10020254_72330 [Streptomyces goshikiensis]